MIDRDASEPEGVGPADEYRGRILAAVALRDIRDYRAALAQLKRAAAVQPDEIEGHLLLGLTYQDLGQPRAAEHALRHAIEIDPESAEARMALGSFLLEHEKYSAAARCLQPLAEQGDDLAAVRAYGRALANTPRGLKRAIKVLEAALRRFPEDDELALELANYYAKQGDPQAVVRVLAPLANSHATVLFPLAEAFRKLDQYDNAIACIEAVADLLPNSPQVWWYLSLLALNARAVGKAIAAATRVTELAPESVTGWGDLALALLMELNWTDAAAAAGTALRLAREQDMTEAETAGLERLLQVAQHPETLEPLSFDIPLPFSFPS